MATSSRIDALRSLLNAAQAVWDAYRESGPGRIDASLFEDVESAIGRVKQVGESRVDDGLIETLRDLCHRCCLRSEGLCFITGEAGLIPRQDLHERFGRSLEELRTFVRQSSE